MSTDEGADEAFDRVRHVSFVGPCFDSNPHRAAIFHCSETYAPFLWVWWRGSADREQMAECVEKLTQICESWTEPKGVLVDFAEVGDFPAPARKQLASWRARTDPLFREKVSMGAHVIRSRLVRGYSTALAL